MSSSHRWDSNADGNFNYQDLMGSFDANKDGVLDQSELSVLVGQLSNQLEYSNSLLSQVQQLEQGQLENQRETKIKDEKIRRLAQERDYLETENNDIKKKLSIAQDLADSLSKNSRDYRIEANSFKHEAENSIKECMNMKSLIEKITTDKNQIHKELVETQNKMKAIADDSDKLKRDVTSQNDILRRMNDSLSREISEIREKSSNLENDRTNLLSHVRELSDSLEEMSSQLNRVSDQASNDARKYAEVKSANEALQASCMEMDMLLTDAVDKASVNHGSNGELKKRMFDLESHLREMQQENDELRSTALNDRDENNNLKKDIELLHSETDDLKKKMGLENEKWANFLQKTRDECNQVISVAKKQAADAIGEAHRQISIATEAQAKAEESYFGLQEEYSKLNSIMQDMQKDFKAAQDAFSTQRRQFEDTIRMLSNKCKSLEDDKKSLEALFGNEKSDLMNQMRNLKQESQLRVSNSIDLLCTLQEEVKSLRDEAFACRNNLKELMSLLVFVQAKCNQQLERNKKLTSFIKNEMDAVISKFQEKHTLIKSDCDKKKDEIKQFEIVCEQEKSKNLNLEENISRLQHKMSALEGNLFENDYVAQDKINKCTAIIEQYTADKGVLEGKIARLQQALDATTSQARSIQSSNQSLQAAVEEASNKYAAERSDFEDRLSHLLQQQQRLIEEREQQAKVQQELNQLVQHFEGELHRSNEETNRAWQEAARLNKMSDEAKGNYMQVMNSVGGTTQQLNLQLQQNQEIIKVVQAQRAELLGQNQQLRSEIDRYANALKQAGVKL